MRILLLGPTAVGKTALSVDVARDLDAEIISVDSRQCYKYLNIGTATPTENEQGDVPHYNLSIIDPGVKDSVANYEERARSWQLDIEQRNKNVLYTGGSTLHVQCTIQPLDDVPGADESNIDRLETQVEEEGVESLYKKLREVDPTYAQKMDGMNTQRIVRALDVWMQTGRPFSSFHSEDNSITVPDDMIVFGLHRNRQALYDRINSRVEQMFAQGLLEEVESILNRGYTLKDPGINTVGYLQAIHYLEGNISYEKMVNNIKTKTRRYAKRQLSWFRRWNFIHWIDLDDSSPEEARNFIGKQVAAKLNKD
ncbi:tRNA (adenosine(37)-N6)-dimethylallyltransferase MiaA [Fodinibius sp.]|uniref:tRNA (adenosine(37)-N6)-dimethylallyltransferase MiaA n=1 Tax=Fodinibius sp. TaxID=1872440 RepID=UPI0035696FB4